METTTWQAQGEEHMMTDQELLEYVETHTIEKMLNGCEIDDHLGYEEHEPGNWAVTFRADIISRLIDMAKQNQKCAWVGLTDDEIAQAMFKADVIVTGPTQFAFARDLEAKLKEKNNG